MVAPARAAARGRGRTRGVHGAARDRTGGRRPRWSAGAARGARGDAVPAGGGSCGCPACARSGGPGAVHPDSVSSRASRPIAALGRPFSLAPRTPCAGAADVETSHGQARGARIGAPGTRRRCDADHLRCPGDMRMQRSVPIRASAALFGRPCGGRPAADARRVAGRGRPGHPVTVPRCAISRADLARLGPIPGWLYRIESNAFDGGANPPNREGVAVRESGDHAAAARRCRSPSAGRRRLPRYTGNGDRGHLQHALLPHFPFNREWDHLCVHDVFDPCRHRRTRAGPRLPAISPSGDLSSSGAAGGIPEMNGRGAFIPLECRSVRDRAPGFARFIAPLRLTRRPSFAEAKHEGRPRGVLGAEYPRSNGESRIVAYLRVP